MNEVDVCNALKGAKLALQEVKVTPVTEDEVGRSALEVL